MSLIATRTILLGFYFLASLAESRRLAIPKIKSEIPDGLLFVEDVKKFKCEGDPFTDSILNAGIFASEKNYFNQAKIKGQSTISVEYFDKTRDDDQKDSYFTFYGPGILSTGNPFSSTPTRYIWKDVDIAIELPSLRGPAFDTADFLVSDFFITIYFSTDTTSISEDLELKKPEYVSMLQNVPVFNNVPNEGDESYLQDFYFQIFTYRLGKDSKFSELVGSDYASHLPFLGSVFGNSIMTDLASSSYIYVFWEPMQVLLNSTSDDYVSCFSQNIEIVGCRALTREYEADFVNGWGETTHHSGGLMQNGIEIELSGSYTNSGRFWSITFPFELPENIGGNPKDVYPNIALAVQEGRPEHYFGRGSGMEILPGAESNFFFIDNYYIEEKGAELQFNRFPKDFSGFYLSDCFQNADDEFFCPFQILSDANGVFLYFSDGNSAYSIDQYEDIAETKESTISSLSGLSGFKQGEASDELKISFECSNPICDSKFSSAEIKEYQNTMTIMMACFSHNFDDLDAGAYSTLKYDDDESVEVDCYDDFNFIKEDVMHYCAICEFEGGETGQAKMEIYNFSPDPDYTTKFTQFAYTAIFSRTGRLGLFYWLDDIEGAFDRSNSTYEDISMTGTFFRGEYPQKLSFEMTMTGPAKPTHEFHFIFQKVLEHYSDAEIELNGFSSSSPSSECLIYSLSDFNPDEDGDSSSFLGKADTIKCFFHTQLSSDSKLEIVVVPKSKIEASYLVFELQGLSLRENSLRKASERYDVLESVILFSDGGDEILGVGSEECLIEYEGTTNQITVSEIEYRMNNPGVETDITVTIEIGKTVCHLESFVLYFSNVTLDKNPSGCSVIDAGNDEYLREWARCSVENYPEVEFAPFLSDWVCIESPELKVTIHDFSMPEYISAYSSIQVIQYYNSDFQGIKSNEMTMPAVHSIDESQGYLEISSSLLYKIPGWDTKLTINAKILQNEGFQENEKLIVRFSSEFNGVIGNTDFDCFLEETSYPCRFFGRNELVIEGFVPASIPLSFTVAIQGIPIPESASDGSIWLGILSPDNNEYLRLFNKTQVTMTSSSSTIDLVYVFNISKSDSTPKQLSTLSFVMTPQTFIGKEAIVVIRFIDIPPLLLASDDIDVGIQSYPSGSTVSGSFTQELRTLKVGLSASLEEYEMYLVTISGIENQDDSICSPNLFSLKITSGSAVIAQTPVGFNQFTDDFVATKDQSNSLSFVGDFQLKKWVRNEVEVEINYSSESDERIVLTPKLSIQPFSSISLKTSLPEFYFSSVGGRSTSVLVSIVDEDLPEGFYEMALKSHDSEETLSDFLRTEIIEVEVVEENITISLNDGMFLTNPETVSRPFRVCLDEITQEDIEITFEILALSEDKNPLFSLSEKSLILGGNKQCGFIYIDGTHYTVAPGRSALLMAIPDKDYVSYKSQLLQCLSIESSTIDYSLSNNDLSSHSVTIECVPERQGNYYLYLAPSAVFDSRVSSSFEHLTQLYTKERTQLNEEIIMEFPLSQRSETVTFEIEDKLLAQTQYSYVIIGLLSGLSDLSISGEFETPEDDSMDALEGTVITISGTTSDTISNKMILNAICPLAYYYFISPEDIGTANGLPCHDYYEASFSDSSSDSDARERFLLGERKTQTSTFFSDGFSDAFSDSEDLVIDPVEINILLLNSKRSGRDSTTSKVSRIDFQKASDWIYSSLVEAIPDIAIELKDSLYSISPVEIYSDFLLEVSSTSFTASGFRLNDTGMVCYALFQGSDDVSTRLVYQEASGLTDEVLDSSTGSADCVFFEGNPIELSFDSLYSEVFYTFAYFGKSLDFRKSGDTTELVYQVFETLVYDDGSEESEEEFGRAMHDASLMLLGILFCFLFDLNH